jgi:hypothetical protein
MRAYHEVKNNQYYWLLFIIILSWYNVSNAFYIPHESFDWSTALCWSIKCDWLHQLYNKSPAMQQTSITFSKIFLNRINVDLYNDVILINI